MAFITYSAFSEAGIFIAILCYNNSISTLLINLAKFKSVQIFLS